MQMELEKAKLLEELRMKDATVTFTKKDGTQRIMRCTLRPEALPEIITESTRTSTERRESDSTIAVWDLDLGAWRSFRLDSVVDISF
jgi:hypothetical protein